MAFGGAEPVAFSGAVWVRDATTGPFLDVWIARFESAEVASAAIQSLSAELIACGEFVDPGTTALGSFSPGADPGLGDESFGVDYAGVVASFPVNRYGAVVRIGDTLYSSALAALFAEPDVAAVMHALNAIGGF